MKKHAFCYLLILLPGATTASVLHQNEHLGLMKRCRQIPNDDPIGPHHFFIEIEDSDDSDDEEEETLQIQEAHSDSAEFNGTYQLYAESESSDTEDTVLDTDSEPPFSAEMLELIYDNGTGLDAKFRETYDLGIAAINNSLQDFRKDKEEYEKLLGSWTSTVENEQRFHELQSLVSIHTIQFMKFDLSFWVLLDRIANCLGLQSPEYLDLESSVLHSDIHIFESEIKIKILEAELTKRVRDMHIAFDPDR